MLAVLNYSGWLLGGEWVILQFDQGQPVELGLVKMGFLEYHPELFSKTLYNKNKKK